MPLIARSGRKLVGTVRVPGDRALTLRALVLAAAAVGRTSLKSPFPGVEARRLAAALAALGAAVTDHGGGLWTVDGVGVGGLGEPAEVLDLGGSREALHLLMGLVASHPLTAVFTGDAVLNGQPLARLVQALERVGAQFIGRRGGLLPLAVVGATAAMPVEHRLAAASGPLKAALLLAGLNTPGITAVVEPQPAGDEGIERLLALFGARIETDMPESGLRRVRLHGQPELAPATVELPSDPSLAALPLVAALAGEGSEVTVETVRLDPLGGLLATLQDMGADIAVLNARTVAGEPVGDLRARSSRLKGVVVPAGRAPTLLRDYPVLAVAAAQASGTTVLPGAGGDGRFAALAQGLAAGLMACGVVAAAEGDGLAVRGVGPLAGGPLASGPLASGPTAGGPMAGGVRLAADTPSDLASALLVLGLGAPAPVEAADGAAIEAAFPDFAGLMQRLGADLTSKANP